MSQTLSETRLLKSLSIGSLNNPSKAPCVFLGHKFKKFNSKPKIFGLALFYGMNKEQSEKIADACSERCVRCGVIQ